MMTTSFVSVLAVCFLVLTSRSQAFTSRSQGVTNIAARQSLVRGIVLNRQQDTKLHVLVDPSLTISALTNVLPPTSIHDAFSVATFLPQPFWFLLVVLPNSGITKKIMGGMGTSCHSSMILPQYKYIS